MRRLVPLLLVALLLPGCAALKGWFTTPTGVITVDRQEFLDTWGLVRQLGVEYLAAERVKAACQTPVQDAARCLLIFDAERKAKTLALYIDAKIATPETTVNKEAVAALLAALLALRP
jgi:hypothetical protein